MQREWQRELVDQIESITESPPVFEAEQQAPKVAVSQVFYVQPWMIGILAAIVCFIILLSVQPSFLQKTEKDRYYESRSFHIPLGLLLSVGIGLLVTFLDVSFLSDLLK